MQSALGEHYRAQTDSDGADKATGYYEDGGAVRVYDDLNAQCKFGGGGLIASSRDPARMGAAFAAGDIVDRAALPEVVSPYTTSSGEEITYVYGMGAGYAESASSHYALHSGGSPGGRAYLAVFIDHDVSVALTGNFDGPQLSDVAIGLARLAAGLELPEDDG